MTHNKLYEITDRYISVMLKRLIDLYMNIKTADFDEVDNLRSVYDLFSIFDDYLHKSYEKLAKAIYSKAAVNLPIFKTSLVASILSEYNRVTKYQFEDEFLRKRDRLIEMLVAVGTSDSKELKKSQNLMARQVTQYAIEVTDRTVLQAFEDMGYTQVQWHTADDEKVCPICAKRDGRIYDINTIPFKPHYGCRCWYSPYEAKATRYTR